MAGTQLDKGGFHLHFGRHFANKLTHKRSLPRATEPIKNKDSIVIFSINIIAECAKTFTFFPLHHGCIKTSQLGANLYFCLKFRNCRIDRSAVGHHTKRCSHLQGRFFVFFCRNSSGQFRKLVVLYTTAMLFAVFGPLIVSVTLAVDCLICDATDSHNHLALLT